MIRFERTKDYGLIKRVMTDPGVYPKITDDFSVSAEQFEPIQSDLLWYVAAWDNEQLLGVFLLAPRNGIEYQVHNYLLPGSRRLALKVARLGLAWAWENIKCRRIIGVTPAHETAALKVAAAAGMTRFGLDEKSLMRGGVLYDQVYTGASAPD